MAVDASVAALLAPADAEPAPRFRDTDPEVLREQTRRMGALTASPVPTTA
ncbi:hypothetical protein OOK31_05140 [Streptomyces sp. NBC_00249]|nr:hypothetical protein [Streptomyces sp. NBC_00249]MCX5193281.1 hypothetical protein [Streptomyces sp. NBC_00249]